MTPRSGPGPWIGAPSIKTAPASGFSRPAIKFRSVVLPQPEGPTRQTNSPLPIENDMSWTAAVTPRDADLKRLETARTSITRYDGARSMPYDALRLRRGPYPRLRVRARRAARRTELR